MGGKRSTRGEPSPRKHILETSELRKEPICLFFVREMFVDHHDVQLKLCDRLENIADSLPNNIDVQECLVVARLVYPVVKEAHRFEEEYVFPLVDTVAFGPRVRGESLERLRYEHWEDESYAEEISECLVEFVTEPNKRNTDSLSYLLRGFFDGMRRHIAFETEYILPVLTTTGNGRS